MSLLIALLPLYGPLVFFVLGFWLIRWTERRDWKAAHEEVQDYYKNTSSKENSKGEV